MSLQSGKAVALIRSAAALDSVSKIYIDTVVSDDGANRTSTDAKYGVKFSQIEGDSFSLMAVVHRRIVDVEVQHAIWSPPDHQADAEFLVGKVNLFLRGAKDERTELDCNYIMFSEGSLHLSSSTFNLINENTADDKGRIRDSLAELILVRVHEQLPKLKTS